MFGPTEQAGIVGLSLVAAATDLARGKIYNWLTLGAFSGAIAFHLYASGLYGLGTALLGAGTGLAVYGWMFLARFMGAGDVKMLMALGAWGGAAFALQAGVLGVLVGGVAAFFQLLFAGKLGAFLNKMRVFWATFIAKGLRLQWPEADRSLKMPFGVSLAIAAIWIVADNPFVRWGFVS